MTQLRIKFNFAGQCFFVVLHHTFTILFFVGCEFNIHESCQNYMIKPCIEMVRKVFVSVGFILKHV